MSNEPATRGNRWEPTEEDLRFAARLAELNAGDLAKLRRAAGLSIRDARIDWRFFRWLPSGNASANLQEVCFLTATLFAVSRIGHSGQRTSPDRTGVGNMGDSMRRLASIMRNRDSVDRRFAILLDSRMERVDDGHWEPGELGYRLRQVVRLLATQRAPGPAEVVDWAQLLHDLRRWESPDNRRGVQKRWAQSYFSRLPEDGAVDPPDATRPREPQDDNNENNGG